MIRAACHCGAVRFEIAEAPDRVLDCNCTICRRYGGLWAYYHGERQSLLVSRPAPGTTSVYLWGDRELAIHRCRECGCVTHSTAVAGDPPEIYCVNARMMVGLDPARVRVQQVDNGCTGFFWTRADEPVIPNRQGPMPPSDDWR